MSEVSRCPRDGDGDFSRQSLAGAVALWGCLYLGLRTLLHQKAEYTSRLVALLHALVVMLMGGYLCAMGVGPHFQISECESMKRSHYTLFTISFGYFAYDLVFCLWQCKETGLMILHHVYSVFSLLRILSRGIHGTPYACGLAAMEFTNPLLQARWFIRAAGHERSVYFYVVEGIFIITFVLLRGFYGTYLWVHVLLTPGVDLENKIQATMMHFISLAFIYNILKYIRTKYLKKLGSASRNNMRSRFSDEEVSSAIPSITRTPLVNFNDVNVRIESPGDSETREGER